MTQTKMIAAGLAALLPVSALATEHEACPLDYGQFEIGVPHTDMENCPASFEIEDAYCRLSVVAEVATVFAFAEDTDCIVATRAYYEDEFELTFD